MCFLPPMSGLGFALLGDQHVTTWSSWVTSLMPLLSTPSASYFRKGMKTNVSIKLFKSKFAFLFFFPLKGVLLRLASTVTWSMLLTLAGALLAPNLFPGAVLEGPSAGLQSGTASIYLNMMKTNESIKHPAKKWKSIMLSFVLFCFLIFVNKIYKENHFEFIHIYAKHYLFRLILYLIIRFYCGGESGWPDTDSSGVWTVHTT